MKDRILYLVEGIADLGIAHSLSKKFDCDLYALIDTNKHVKTFFEEQQIVKFQKIWYYRDHILKPNRTPDLKYLSNFEKKYGINLWMIAYSDRIFYQYNDYYKFKNEEILLIFEQECKLFEKILDEINPNFAIIKSPDYNQSQLLLELCKARGITILTLSLSRFGYRYVISEKTDRLDNYDKIIDNYSKHDLKTIEDLQNYMRGYWAQNVVVKKEHRASMRKKLKGSLRYLFLVCNNEYRKYYVNFGRTRWRVIINESVILLKKIVRENFMKKHFLYKIDKNDNFVFFPLHFEPERGTLIDAPFYTNQLEVIKNIAKSLPAEYKLYVKEHPVQVLNGWRNISYYKKILEMPNVKLLHPSVSNDEILKNCSLVVTITGTLGLEAAFYNKPSIVFADVIYSGLSSVLRLRSLEELPQSIRSSLSKKVSLSDLNKYAHCIIENSFEYDGAEFDARIHNQFFYGGFLFDVKLSPQEVLSVIEENKATFDKLSSEYIKKINEHKKQQFGVS